MNFVCTLSSFYYTNNTYTSDGKRTWKQKFSYSTKQKYNIFTTDLSLTISSKPFWNQSFCSIRQKIILNSKRAGFKVLKNPIKRRTGVTNTDRKGNYSTFFPSKQWQTSFTYCQNILWHYIEMHTDLKQLVLTRFWVKDIFNGTSRQVKRSKGKNTLHINGLINGLIH